MGMSTRARVWTAEDVRAMQDEASAWPRYELVDGELLVTPAPRYAHQEVVGRIFVALRLYLARQPAVGHAMLSPADISFGLPDVLVQPDVFVLARDEARHQAWSAVTRLLLAVEVLSPSSTRQDRFQKRRLYQEQGVPLYWIVDVDARTVEVWTPELHFPHVEHESLTWAPAGATQPFVMGVEELVRGA